MGRRLASLDIGSNSLLCLIVEQKEEGVLSVVTDQVKVTGLGRGLSAAGLHPESKARTLEVLRTYRALMDALEVREVYAAATAAMRDAADGERFAREIRESLHIPVEIISGDREAYLTWLAVAEGFGRTHPIAVVDIGGRSTEVMHGTGRQLAERVSLPIGSVSGTEQFLEGDPLTRACVDRFRRHVRERLSSLPAPRGELELFGVAATVTTFATMAFQLPTYQAAAIHGTTLTREMLDHLLEQLIELPVAHRTALIGLEPDRADVIVAGGLILRETLDHFGQGRLTVSDHGLRHGLLYEAHPGTLLRDPRL